MPVRLGKTTLGLGPISDLSDGLSFRTEMTSQNRGLGMELFLEIPDVKAAFERVTDSGYPVSTELQDKTLDLTEFRISIPMCTFCGSLRGTDSWGVPSRRTKRPQVGGRHRVPPEVCSFRT